MGPQTIRGSQELAAAIRERRRELGLTLEEAAGRAGVGTKTWCRYESGESIRRDKYRGVCKALNWRAFPEEDAAEEAHVDLSAYRDHKAWSKELEEQFGEDAAASFAIGSDILLDHIEEDLQELARRPRGTHMGQLDCSFLADQLPPQFLTRYDYEFLYTLRAAVRNYRKRVRWKIDFTAHSVLEELALYLTVEESRLLMDEAVPPPKDGWDTWIFDLFDDMDLVTFLYSDDVVTPEDIYHFDHWQKREFYTE